MNEEQGWSKANLKAAAKDILIGALILNVLGWIFFGIYKVMAALG